MAYAFNAIDDFYRRSKEGKLGGSQGLQKGGEGAPAPATTAASNLAQTAETSGEQGNAAGSAAASRFGAMQKAPTSAIAGRLAAPGQQQAQSWQKQSEKQEGEYRTGAQKQGQETFKEFKPEDVGGVEAGESGAMQRVGGQMAYGTENAPAFDLAPMQVSIPTLDTTSMLSGGIGGLQAALQKRGGRYTPGMAAMDAAAFAGNRGAIGQLQGQFGDIQEGMRLRGEQMRGLEGQLEGEQTERGKRIAADVREALGSRSAELEELSKANLEAKRKGKETESFTEAGTLANQYAKGGGGSFGQRKQAGTGTVLEDIDPGFANVFRMLYGRDPTPEEANYITYAPDYEAMDAYLAQNQAEKDAAAAAAKQSTGIETSQIGPQISPTGEVTPPPPGVIAVSGGSPETEPLAPPRPPTPSEQVKPTMPIAGMSSIGADIQTAGGTQAPIPSNVKRDMLDAKTQTGYSLSDPILKAFHGQTGRWPTREEMDRYVKTGSFEAPKRPKFTIMGRSY